MDKISMGTAINTELGQHQEWTDLYVLELLGDPKSHKPLAEGWSLHPDLIRNVIDAHKAELTAEREKVELELEQQTKKAGEIYQSLLSAQAAIKKHNKRFK